MALSDLTFDAVLQAIAEFDALKRDAFLQKYHYGKSRGYFLIHNGTRYDSKAIAGAAHGYVPGLEPLQASKLSGGDKSVANRLRKLGFVVPDPSDTNKRGIPFEVGSVYNRQRDIHQVFGGQERGGITTPSDCPFVFLFTGESGEQFGYSDGWRPDGVFAYTGEGQQGDMTFVRGNRAIRDHMTDGRDLLLFEATKTRETTASSVVLRLRDGRRSRLPTAMENNETQSSLNSYRLQRRSRLRAWSLMKQISKANRSRIFRSLALAAAATPKVPSKESQRTYYIRSAKVKAYVLKRANGHCEPCKKAAPFVRIGRHSVFGATSH